MIDRSATDELEYIRRREAQERAAAKRAVNVSERRTHQERAQRYARLALDRG